MILYRFLCVLSAGLALQGCEQTAATATPIGETAPAIAAVVQPVQPAASANRISGSVANTPFAKLIRKGVANAPSTAASSSVLAAAGSRITAERSAYQPQLSAEGAINSDGDAVPILRLSQIIYDGGRTKKRVSLRKTQADQIYESEVASLSARAFEAVEVLINLDRDRRLQAQAQRNVALVGSLVDDLDDRFSAGAGSVADVLTASGPEPITCAWIPQLTMRMSAPPFTNTPVMWPMMTRFSKRIFSAPCA